VFSIIPSDVASRIKQATDSVSATASVKKAKDALADLIPGQRVLAQIQALLPNGAYRAVVAQREIVLALPHSAKAGDTLELEVVDHEGRLTFALVKEQNSQTEKSTLDSVSTSLSKTGKLISELLSPPGKEGQRPTSLSLNGNQPIISTPLSRGSQIVDVLQESIIKSGMFYEAHQAAWAEGKLATSALLAEPQGKFSSLESQRLAEQHPDLNPFADAINHPVFDPDNPDPAYLKPFLQIVDENSSGDPNLSSKSVGNFAAELPQLVETKSHNSIPQALAPIIQQQLEAFASQNYVWQGIAWPGQAMEWEIKEEDSHGNSSENEEAYRWQTSLKLQLPLLGNLTATLKLRGENQIDVQIQTADLDSEIKLSLGGPTLDRQLEDAGLYLATFSVQQASNPLSSPITDESSDE
jgi:hypothetical protein